MSKSHRNRFLEFLPTSKKEMDALGWDQADIILFTGDAYVDHPSFGAAVIGRILEREGYKVAIIPQPNWRDDLRDFKKLGAPRLFFAVTSGCMDSMVNHYTANKRLRSDDAYTAGGKSGNRPDYAVKVYSNIIKNLYPDTPLIIGGVEASLRRFTHYDYWANKLLPSIVIESGADLLVYGMGEKSIVEIANALADGKDLGSLTGIPQTVFQTTIDYTEKTDKQYIKLNNFDECLKYPKKFGENFLIIEEESNKLNSKLIAEGSGDFLIVANPPYSTPSTKEMDSWWDLPFARSPHPRYTGKAIPAWEMIKYSVNIHRGCFGGCSFCTISAHQGKFVSSRSEESILAEVEKITHEEDFKGYLSDLGGPSANMYGMKGKDQNICLKCKKPSCIYPSICKNLNTDHKPLINLYQRVRNLKGIKKVFVGSGIRCDLFSDWSNPVNRDYFENLVRHHVSGKLKVAPEHTEDKVLILMRKPSFKLFEELKERFDAINDKHSLRQIIVPYFISSHPSCSFDDMQSLSAKMKKMRLQADQVQDFTPTPMTLASTIFYTGVDPYSGKKIFTERTKEGKQKQKDLFFWKNQSNPSRTNRNKRRV